MKAKNEFRLTDVAVTNRVYIYIGETAGLDSETMA